MEVSEQQFYSRAPHFVKNRRSKILITSVTFNYNPGYIHLRGLLFFFKYITTAF